MSRRKHDPEDRSSSEWFDKLFKMGGRSWEEVRAEREAQAQADAEKEYMTQVDWPHHLGAPPPEWVAPDEVTPDDDGNITVTILSVEGERKMPESPKGVVVHLRDGSSQATEVVWVGTGLTGNEMWEVTARFKFDEIKRITIEFLPAKSEVHIGGSGGPSAEG